MPGRVAIFVRNHEKYLESAARASRERPEQPITFRSAKPWRRAKDALEEQSSLEVYYAPLGAKGMIKYRATLHKLLLNPKAGDADTEDLLQFELSETKGEGLWEESVRTLYVISHCRRLQTPFSMSALHKVSNDQPIAPNYGYGYVLVWEHAGVTGEIETLPDEVDDPEKYFEGAVRQVSVNAYERSPAARQKCLEHYGFDCAVCGFNFGQIFGDIGEGFIHVHHLRPLAETDEVYQVDPIKDLRPVCPNCHAMLHKNTPPYSIDELRRRRQRASRSNES